MISNVAFQVIQVTVKDWAIDGRTGTSHKAQILVEQEGLLSTLLLKFKPEHNLVRGMKYVGKIEITDALTGGYSVVLESATPDTKKAS